MACRAWKSNRPNLRSHDRSDDVGLRGSGADSQCRRPEPASSRGPQGRLEPLRGYDQSSRTRRREFAQAQRLPSTVPFRWQGKRRLNQRIRQKTKALVVRGITQNKNTTYARALHLSRACPHDGSSDSLPLPRGRNKEWTKKRHLAVVSGNRAPCEDCVAGDLCVDRGDE